MEGPDIFMTNWIRDYIVGNETTVTVKHIHIKSLNE